MMALNRARLVFHGAVILLLSMVIGIPLFVAVQHGSAEEVVQFWRSAHVGLAIVGLWSIATGAVLDALVLDDRDASVVVWSLVVSNYAITIAILVRGLAHPLGFDASVFPWSSLVASARNVSAIAGFIAGIGTVRGGWAAVRAAKTDARRVVSAAA